MRVRPSSCLLLILMAAGPASKPATQPTLREWVERYSATSILRKGSAIPLLATITCVTDEEHWNGGEFASVIAQSLIGVDGSVRQMVHTTMGTHGSENHVDDLDQLKEQLEHLPAGAQILPPPDRRVLIEVAGQSYVYDRGNLPTKVLAVCRNGRAMVGAWMPTFEPKEALAIHDNNEGALTLSRDGRQIVMFQGYRQRTQIDVETHKIVSQAKCEFPFVDSFAVSPDHRLMAVDASGDIVMMDTDHWNVICQIKADEEPPPTHYVSPTFTADGKTFLCTQFDFRRSVRAYDPKTGKLVATPAYIPADTVQWIESPSGHFAVFAPKDDSTHLWDIKAGREITKLADHVHFDQTSFSPDDSMVAICTRTVGSDREKCAVGLWRTRDGSFLHDLAVAERGMFSPGEAVSWTPDSRYVLVATKVGPVFEDHVIGVWNASTGRHRGSFAAKSFLRLTGMSLTHDSHQLAAGDYSGNVYFWDFTTALREIREFERSVGDKID